MPRTAQCPLLQCRRSRHLTGHDTTRHGPRAHEPRASCQDLSRDPRRRLFGAPPGVNKLILSLQHAMRFVFNSCRTQPRESNELILHLSPRCGCRARRGTRGGELRAGSSGSGPALPPAAPLPAWGAPHASRRGLRPSPPRREPAPVPSRSPGATTAPRVRKSRARAPPALPKGTEPSPCPAGPGRRPALPAPTFCQIPRQPPARGRTPGAAAGRAPWPAGAPLAAEAAPGGRWWRRRSRAGGGPAAAQAGRAATAPGRQRARRPPFPSPGPCPAGRRRRRSAGSDSAARPRQRRPRPARGRPPCQGHLACVGHLGRESRKEPAAADSEAQTALGGHWGGWASLSGAFVS